MHVELVSPSFKDISQEEWEKKILRIHKGQDTYKAQEYNIPKPMLSTLNLLQWKWFIAIQVV